MTEVTLYTVGNEKLSLCFVCVCVFGGGMGDGVCGSVCTGWVGLHVIPEKMKICSYLRVVNFPYPQNDS
jgi:hypothetical protein